METNRNDRILPELYFLIQKFLSTSPLQKAYKVLCNELAENQILPNRLDWEGNDHERTFEDLERLYPHIGSNHLLQICSRIGPILDKEIPPSLKGVASLLGSGKQSLLRTNESIAVRKSLLQYATRLHCMPTTANYLTTHNIVNVLHGREIAGPCPRSLLLPCERYSQLQLHRQTLGHLSSVYCLLFDRTGRYIATGADDLLVKIWSSSSGRLLASFRGATGEITDIDINIENSLLAAGSIDRILRVWNLHTGAPVAILTCHTGMITSVNFCPSSMWDVRYLVTTSSDGSVAFWTYNHDARNGVHFVSKPILYQEKMRPGQAQMICSAFSPGGSFLAAGSADHNIRVYQLRGEGDGPVRILETEVHTDRVDSISWAHRGLRFVSGSKDGTAFIWHFESQQWKSRKLCMMTKMPGTLPSDDDDDTKKLHVTMVVWDRSDTFVITAVNDCSLKVWYSHTAQLARILRPHTNEIYVLESHPTDPYVVLSAGHDGVLCVWNVLTERELVRFGNHVEGQGVGAVYDVKWSPDGTMIAASDSYGHIRIFGFGCGDPKMQLLPKELFFHTDYRPLVQDPEHGVLDEQTQIPPHLMPPPFLVDIDGNPYPPMLQRLVPGRGKCTSEQLVPNIVVGTGGRQEVIEGIDGQPRSDIDRMIAALAHRQYGQNDHENAPRAALRLGQRRSGDVEGVRQSTGDWQCDNNIVWTKNTIVTPLTLAELEYAKEHIDFICNLEMDEYKTELKRRPVMICTLPPTATKPDKNKRRRKNGNQNTRATRSTEADEPEVDQDADESNSSTHSHHSDYSSTKEDDLSSESSDNESSGYSDWVADQGVNLEPPKRSKRKSAHRRVQFTDTDEDEDADAGEDEEEYDEEDDEDGPRSKSKRRSNGEKSRRDAVNGTHDEEEPSTSSTTKVKSKVKKSPTTKKNNNTIKAVKQIVKNGEVPELYKPLEWLAETVPRKAPYWPQMGDEVVYFMQGHQIYVDAVRNKNIYNVNPRDLPWTRQTLKDHEFVKIVGIKYEIRPPRLCCLKLALLDDDKRLTDQVFTVKYHDMADVLDFFVLKQTYEIGLSRNWSPDDRFRCMIEDAWWMGQIVSKSPLSEQYPDSLFSCYETQWDSGELERMSPWDLEPLCEDRMPENIGEAVPVLADELQSLLYQPTVDEWPDGGRNTACARINSGLDYVMGLAIAEPFLAPVDLNIYPSYAFIVEYPVDLSAVKARLENHFYRRITAVQFDVRYLATNAEKFNKPHSCIVKYARIITEVCLKIIKSVGEEIDLPSIYHQLMETYESSGSEDEDPEIIRPSPTSRGNTAGTSTGTLNISASVGGSTHEDDEDAAAGTSGLHMNHHNYHVPYNNRALRSNNGNRRLQPAATSSSLPTTRRRHEVNTAAAATTGGGGGQSSSTSGLRNVRYVNDWRMEARRLLELLWSSEDSVPFRAPVNQLKHPDYYQLIDTPMDLGSIKEDLFGGNYENPTVFAKDMRLVFTNSKNYNTNNRSRIFSMTTRLSNKFEEHIRKVNTVWRRSKRTANLKKVRRKKPSTSTNNEDDDEEEEKAVSTSSDSDHANTKRKKPDPPQNDSNDSNDNDDNNVDVESVFLPHHSTNGDQQQSQQQSPHNSGSSSSYSDGEKLPLVNRDEAVRHDEDSSEEEEEEHNTVTNAEEEESSGGSDFQPLSQLQGRRNKSHSSNHRRKGVVSSEYSGGSSDSDDSDEEEEDTRVKVVRRPRKRARLHSNTDSEEEEEDDDDDDDDDVPLQVIRKRRVVVVGTEDEESEEERESGVKGKKPVVTISSRGRVRKMTERARALFRK